MSNQSRPSCKSTAVPNAPPPVCLTIAGFDPSSGAGVTADLKTFAAHGVYGVAAITALTVQSTQGVGAVEAVTPALLRQTLSTLAEDIALAGVKVGMLCRADLVAEADRFLRQSPFNRAARPSGSGFAVLDPVLSSSSGTPLLDAEGLVLVRERLLGAVDWITPNLDELSLLTGLEVRTREQIPGAAAKLAQQAAALGNAQLNLVVTGGHLDRPDDYLLMASGEATWLGGERVETASTHGTGCAFSSALLCALVAGNSGFEAVSAAKQYVAAALRAAYPVGQGRGPIHHLFRGELET